MESNVIINDDKNIIEFLKKETIVNIKDKLLYKMARYDVCDEIIGAGFYGNVFISHIGKEMDVNGQKMQVVIKTPVKEGTMQLKIIDKKLYICGIYSLTTEALILMFTNLLWNKTIHLPYLVDYGTCYNNNVDKIVTVKFGLKKPFTYKIINKSYPLIDNYGYGYNKSQHRTTRLNTLYELFEYIYHTKQDDVVTLPNKKQVELYKLIDYISISFLATCKLLHENNIFVEDMHEGNIFIQWFDEFTHPNLETIIYNIENKYYKIETNGFAIVLGDLGMSNIKIRDDVYLMGQMLNIEGNYEYMSDYIKTKDYARFFVLLRNRLSVNVFEKTVLYKILNSEPYKQYPLNNHYEYPFDKNYYKNVKNINELLNFYDEKYKIDKPKESKTQIII